MPDIDIRNLPVSRAQIEGLRDALSTLLEQIPPDKPAGEAFTDEQRIQWLQKAARKSPTGISFDWVPSTDSEPSGFRFMRRHFVGDACNTLRQAIDRAMRDGKWQP